MFQVIDAFGKAEKKKKPNMDLQFTDVYAELTPHLQKQMDEMKVHIKSYKEHYPMDMFKTKE